MVRRERRGPHRGRVNIAGERPRRVSGARRPRMACERVSAASAAVPARPTRRLVHRPRATARGASPRYRAGFHAVAHRLTSYELRTTNYELRTTNYEPRATNYPFGVRIACPSAAQEVPTDDTLHGRRRAARAHRSQRSRQRQTLARG